MDPARLRVRPVTLALALALAAHFAVTAWTLHSTLGLATATLERSAISFAETDRLRVTLDQRPQLLRRWAATREAGIAERLEANRRAFANTVEALRAQVVTPEGNRALDQVIAAEARLAEATARFLASAASTDAQVPEAVHREVEAARAALDGFFAHKSQRFAEDRARSDERFHGAIEALVAIELALVVAIVARVRAARA